MSTQHLRHAMPLPAEASPLHSLFNTLTSNNSPTSPPPLYRLHHAMPPPTEASPPHSPTLTSHPLPQLIIHIAPPLYRLHHAMPPQAEASPLTLPLSPHIHPPQNNSPHQPPPLYHLRHAMPPQAEASPLAAKHLILHSCIFSVRV